jgi:GNAT superfamily N-acetyltransferase
MTATPVSQRHQVRKATSLEIPRIATTLAGAFFDDPVFTWWIPDNDRRRATLPAFFELSTTTFLVHDEVYVNDDLGGAALWGPPANPTGIDDEEEYGRRVEKIVADVDLPRVYEIVTMLEEHHPRDPHYYLQWAGVVPARQGQGIGGALLTPVLERCDRDRMPAYTEATSLRNRRLYERHGFTFANEIAPASGPPLYCMWRQPAAR